MFDEIGEVDESRFSIPSNRKFHWNYFSYLDGSEKYRSINKDEIIALKHLWKTYEKGELGFSIIEWISKSPLSQWNLDCFNYLDYRYPFLENGMPKIVQSLFHPLLNQSDEKMSSLVVNVLNNEISQKTCHADGFLFSVFMYFSQYDVINLKVDPPFDGGYGKFRVSLTELGKKIISSKEYIDVREIPWFRWWGMKDLLVE
jgi:hypothetical protein